MAHDKPHFKIYNVGTYVAGAEKETLDVSVQMSQAEFQHFDGVRSPASGLTDATAVTSGAIGIYGSAEGIVELDAAVPDYPGLFWGLFELMATFPKTSSIAIELMENNAIRVLLEGENEGNYGWWEKTDTKIYVTSLLSIPGQVISEDIAPANPALKPSELLYAFSIVAEHIRLGTTQFRVFTELEYDHVCVSFYDHEIKDFRTNIVFPVIKGQPTETH